MNNTAFKTLAMKARVYNFIRKNLFKKDLDSMSMGERNAIFEQIFKINSETHWELVHYKAKRKAKAAITKARVERGWKPKKKTSLSEYKRMKQQELEGALFPHK